MSLNYRAVKLDGLTINVPADPLPMAERVAALSAAFNRVKNAEHWKGPIDALVKVKDADELATITEAIAFYTATEARVYELGDATYRITAPGYWAGPAN